VPSQRPCSTPLTGHGERPAGGYEERNVESAVLLCAADLLALVQEDRQFGWVAHDGVVDRGVAGGLGDRRAERRGLRERALHEPRVGADERETANRGEARWLAARSFRM